MERWEGKVAVVTGSSSGIGAAISTILVENGLTVVGLARREDRLQELAESLQDKSGKFYPLKVDVTVEQEILDAFAWIDETLGGVHVLINNAGVGLSMSPVSEGITEKFKNVLDVNVLALTICSREALQSMKAHGIDDGNIINISSLAGHMSHPIPGSAIYAGSKRAVEAITACMRTELAMEKSKIKLTTISPGVVMTEFFEAAQIGIPPGAPSLSSEDVAETVLFCLRMPKEVVITELHIQPVGENLMSFGIGD